MKMKKQPLLFLLILAAVSGWVFLPCPCQAQQPGFSCVLNPAEKNDSLAWWQTWHPVYETNVAFQATLDGTANETDAHRTTSYTFTLTDVSSYAGYCLNVGSQLRSAKDLVFDDTQPAVPGLTYKASADRQTVAVTCVSPRVSQLHGQR